MRVARATSYRSAPAVLAAFLLVLLLAAPALASVPTFPQLTGRVVDDANVLSPATRSELIGMLQRHEQATGEQVVVVTLPSLQGYSIEDFGYQLGRYWGIGQKDKNTGALLIVAPRSTRSASRWATGWKVSSPTRNPASSSTATSCPNSGAAISTPACWLEPRRY